MPAPDRLLTIPEAADLLNTKTRFAQRLVTERRIRFTHAGRHVRIPESAVREFINGGSGGHVRPADRTFPTKTQAEQWLTRTEADLLAGDWTDPDAALITSGSTRRTGSMSVRACDPRPLRSTGMSWAATCRSPERAVLTVRQVFTLASVIDPRYRAMVLLGVFTSLRWGELAVLRRSDINLAARTVRVHRTLTHLSDEGHTFGPPKPDAGHRTVVYPVLISSDLADHLERFAASSDGALVFTSPNGTPLRHSNFRRRIWLKAIEYARLPAAHFPDLRHTGNNMTAESGATIRELMDRMGHSSSRAALIYQHGSTAAGHRRHDGKTRRPDARG